MENLSFPIYTNSHKEDIMLGELNYVLTKCKNNETPGEDNTSINKNILNI
jgi:hypothetical protein